MHILLQLSANNLFHIDHLAVLKPHTLSKARVLIVEMLVSVEGHVGKPADFLGAGAAENCEVLVSHVDLDLERLILLNLRS